MGPKYLIIKKGTAPFFDKEKLLCPALPLEEVYDPTGAGDTFAGGFIGSLRNQRPLILNMKRAIIYGSAMASLTVEKLERMKSHIS